MNAEKALWGSDLAMSERHSSSGFHAVTFSIKYSSTHSGVPRATPVSPACTSDVDACLSEDTLSFREEFLLYHYP